jgi:hypothetical protein
MYAPSHGDLLLYRQVFERLRGECQLPESFVADWTGSGAKGEESVDARLAHFVVAGTDEETELGIEIAIGLAYRTLVVVRLWMPSSLEEVDGERAHSPRIP